jgi:pyrimidine operon attenuation protein/uracil phosphoribosyltransferase
MTDCIRTIDQIFQDNTRFPSLNDKIRYLRAIDDVTEDSIYAGGVVDSNEIEMIVTELSDRIYVAMHEASKNPKVKKIMLIRINQGGRYVYDRIVAKIIEKDQTIDFVHAAVTVQSRFGIEVKEYQIPVELYDQATGESIQDLEGIYAIGIDDIIDGGGTRSVLDKYCKEGFVKPPVGVDYVFMVQREELPERLVDWSIGFSEKLRNGIRFLLDAWLLGLGLDYTLITENQKPLHIGREVDMTRTKHGGIYAMNRDMLGRLKQAYQESGDYIKNQLNNLGLLTDK